MRILLNIIWLVFGGLVLALGYAVVAIGDVHSHHHDPVRHRVRADRPVLPLAVRPRDRAPCRRRRRFAGRQRHLVPLLAGWWLALGHLITGILMCLTIIGVPLGLANFKLIPVSLTPFGRDIVDVEQARRLGYADAVGIPD